MPLCLAFMLLVPHNKGLKEELGPMYVRLLGLYETYFGGVLRDEQYIARQKGAAYTAPFC